MKFHMRESDSSNDKNCMIDREGETVFKSSLDAISRTYGDSLSNLFEKST